MPAQPATPDPTEPTPSTTSSAEPGGQQPHLTAVPTPGETAPTSEPPAPTGEDTEASVEDDSRTWREVAHDRLERARAAGIAPPDVWNEPRPALVEQVHYARYTEQLPPTGVVRYLAIGYTAVSGVYTTRDYIKAWIRERPARTAVFTVLLTLAALFPPTRAVLTVWLWLPHTVIELITNY